MGWKLARHTLLTFFRSVCCARQKCAKTSIPAFSRSACQNREISRQNWCLNVKKCVKVKNECPTTTNSVQAETPPVENNPESAPSHFSTIFKAQYSFSTG